MKKIVLVFLILFSFAATAQIDSLNKQDCSLRISLLTCAPGQELYSTFGHSAIRVTNTKTSSDLVYNYGTFEFDDPYFIQKFIHGNLEYFISVDSFPLFIWEYQYYHRGVTEQLLNLSCDEKNKIEAALLENIKEENKFYRYDFTFDNCTTRIRDLLKSNSSDSIQTKNILPNETTSFRNLLHEYLDTSGRNWSKLGIDILLGSDLDRTISNNEAMFLPDYLLHAADSSNSFNGNLVLEKTTLLPITVFQNIKSFFTPFLIFSIFFLLIIILSLINSTQPILKFFDLFFFFSCGALGFFLLYMGYFTTHSMFKNNFNLLWALPTHLVVSFMIFSTSKWIKKYFRISFYINLLLMASWWFLPQEMNIALLPLVGISTVRSFFRSK